VDSLDSWSPSIGLIVHRVPRLCVVTAVVSGVLLRSYQRHPLTWIRGRAADRQQLGATLQVLARASSLAAVQLDYRPLLSAEALLSHGRSARAITQVVGPLVVEHARRLMQSRAEYSEPGLVSAIGAHKKPSHSLIGNSGL
jgi:hypothetical protein